MGAMAQADVGHGVNAAFPEGKIIQGHEIRCVATTANGTCGALLRDKDGHQARDDVFFARKACVHGLCGACLVGQVLKCTSEGQVYKCPVCEHSWTSWDVRSRRVDVVASAAGGSKKRKTETFQATKQTWGQDPKRINLSVRGQVLAPPAASAHARLALCALLALLLSRATFASLLALG